MNKDLINAYAHGNLHEALLVQLFVQSIRDQSPARTTADRGSLADGQIFRQLRSDIHQYLKAMEYDRGDAAQIEQIRQTTSRLADNFFAIVKDVLEP